jgi:hypothetical protein
VAPVNTTAGAAPGAAGLPPPAPRRISVWGTPDRVANLEFAADVAAAVLPAFEAAFGVPYVLPKLDLVAIPDFSAGAMENWGLITYRETALLTSPTSSATDLRHVTTVVAHEMAHQASAGRALRRPGLQRATFPAAPAARGALFIFNNFYSYLFFPLRRPLTNPRVLTPLSLCSGSATW